MTPWTPTAELAPEIELLVRRWHLPPDRIPLVRRLLEAEHEGATALALAGSPCLPSLPNRATSPDAAWGGVCHLLPPHPGAALALDPRPLVLRTHAGGWHLQPWRYFRAEETIARELLARADQAAPPLRRPALDLLTDLGPAELNERQSRAVACALEHRLAVVTGGPGTGKTHTLARLLALLVAADPARPPAVRLAAPTGKAADRMKEAVEAAADRLPDSIPAAARLVLQQAAAGACTLHRLLGFNPATGRCDHGPHHPLRSDVVIVDECSMVDTLLWQTLLAALAPATRLVLVGDPHQLESVAAGDVLGSILRFARSRPDTPLARVCTALTESHRFRHRPAIGRLAAAVVGLRADEARELLSLHPPPADGTAPAGGVVWLGEPGSRLAWEDLPGVVRDSILAVADAALPEEALAALGRVRLLTAHREHALGAAGLNAALHQHLLARAGRGRIPNQPVIVNVNDPETGLTNGSVGVVMEREGTRAAWFPAASAAAAPRRIALSQLPDHSPAWAMTIHRSQGSEFDHVVVVLPSADSPLATRELLYTGLTRARECVHVWGGEATVRAALGERALRCTLLEASLQAATAGAASSGPAPA